MAFGDVVMTDEIMRSRGLVSEDYKRKHTRHFGAGPSRILAALSQASLYFAQILKTDPKSPVLSDITPQPVSS